MKRAAAIRTGKMPNADQNSEHEKIAALEASLKEANARLAKLARERHDALAALAAFQRSASFRLGALLTAPLRLLRAPRSGLFGQPIAPPSEKDTAALAAPELFPEMQEKAPAADNPAAKRNEHAGAPTAEYAARVAAERAGRADPAPVARPLAHEGDPSDPYCAAPNGPLADPSSREFYEYNGFAVFRNLVTHEECAAAARQYKRDLVTEDYLVNPHTTLNVSEVYEPSRDFLFDPRLLGVMRKCLGDDIRFLQWSTYQLNHMSFPWHRDGAYREYGVGHDWDESEYPYRVGKIILYLDCAADFALAVYPKSHKGEIDRSTISSQRSDFWEVRRHHRSAPEDLSRKPCLVHASTGDAVVFDQRLMHCGRLLDNESDAFTRQISSDKSFVSYLYGADNPHSYRFFSYFNQERGFDVAPMGDALVEQLKREGLYLSIGQQNYFDLHPEDREHLWLPQRTAA